MIMTMLTKTCPRTDLEQYEAKAVKSGGLLPRRIRSKRRVYKWWQRKGGCVLLTAPLTRLLTPRSVPRPRAGSTAPHRPDKTGELAQTRWTSSRPDFPLQRTIERAALFLRGEYRFQSMRLCRGEFFHWRLISHRMVQHREASPRVAFSRWSYCTFDSTLGNQTIMTLNEQR